MFLTYLILGFTVALPVGAVSIQMMKEALQRGFLNAWLVGLGAVIIDVVLLVALNVGLADILNSIQVFMWLLGSLFLLFLAVESFKEVKKSEGNLNTGDEPKSKWKAFKMGLVIGINPGNIIFWVSVLGTSIASASTSAEMGIVIISIAILLGIMLHDVILAFVVSRFNKFVTSKTNKWVSIAAGCLLLGFSVYFGINFITELKN